MPVAGGPKITTTGILLEVDAANASSYTLGSSTWVNVFRPGTRNGTINGTVGFTPTDNYGALTFPGTSSTYVDFGNIGDLSALWSFQVAVKPAPSASGNYTILSYASGSNTGSWTYKLDYSSSNQSAVLSVYSATGSARVVHQVTGSVPTGSWSIINASFGAGLVGLNINGIPVGFTVTTGSTVGYSTGSRLYLGGTFGTTSSYYTGSIASFFSYNTDVPGTQLIQNYNAYATRFGLTPSVLNAIITDPDAYNFIEIAGIVGATQQKALNDLVVGMKLSGVWNKVIAVYPFIGGTAYSHKWNLKDPRDTNDAYRLIFYGGWTHSTTGILPNGSNTYADTFWGVNTLLPTIPTLLENIHQGVYPRTTETVSGAQQGAMFAPDNRAAVAFMQNLSNSTTTMYLSSRSNGVSFLYSGKNTGFVLGTRVGTTTNVYKNSALQSTSTYSSLSSTGELNYFIGVTNDRNNRLYYTTAEICFMTLGLGLTNQEAIAYNSIVEQYQATLGRQV